MWKEFRAFISRGNVMDLAVAVVIGTAFTAIVTSLVDDIIMPLIGVVLGGVDPDTAKTYGFDPLTGEPEPGREMAEAEIFSGLLGALGVDTTDSGLPSVPAMRRS